MSAGPAKVPLAIGAYLCEREVGRGGMAEIWLARGGPDPRHGERPVAIKLLHRHLSTLPEIRALFEREVAIGVGLRHRYLAEQLDHGDADGRPYLVLEYVPGPSLRQLLDAALGRGKPAFTLPEALALTTAAARALAYLQGALPERQGGPVILHRDISPGNLLIAQDGVLKLIDFGVALKLEDAARKRQPRGTYGFMAPEQIRGEPLDERADLFSLGALLYELLSGRGAFLGSSPADTLRRTEQASYAPLPHLPAPLGELLTSLLSRDRSGRPANASDLLERLAALASDGIPVAHEATLARLSRPKD